jgi:hypothetical protein
MVLFARDYLTPFNTAAGQAVLTLITAVFAGAFWWMHHIARPRTGARFLVGPTPNGPVTGQAGGVR